MIYIDTGKGWICPKCKRVYSPYVDECRACNKGQPISPSWEEPVSGNTIDYKWFPPTVASALYETRTLTLP